ncbi:MAG: type II toxin-antitoxin system HicB family antitoxin [Elusimicrobia bacterium]|nr:type II toxin-antitoxin system HicB family antitoxin [Elusimicrobiota bacterium]
MGLTSYIQLAMSRASYKMLEDGTFFGKIHGFQGVWANDKNLDHCRRVLQEVLEDWIVLKLRDRDRLPAIQGKTLSLPHTVRA